MHHHQQGEIMTDEDRLFSKRQNAAVKLAMDLEPYDPILGPELVQTYIETLIYMMKQLTRKLNKVGKNIIEVQQIDFEELESNALDKITEEDEDDE